MPMVGEQMLTPDEAIAQHCCPECGRDFKTETNAIACRNSHWRTMPLNNSDGKEGLRRMKLLDEYIIANRVTPSQPAE